MTALQHCLLLQEEITDQARAWEARRVETEAAIAGQAPMSQERMQLRKVLAMEQNLLKALEKLMDGNQDAINMRQGNFAIRQSYPGHCAGMAQSESKIRTLPPSLEMLDRGKAG